LSPDFNAVASVAWRRSSAPPTRFVDRYLWGVSGIASAVYCSLGVFGLSRRTLKTIASRFELRDRLLQVLEQPATPLIVDRIQISREVCDSFCARDTRVCIS
jgi:hypothetical protein